MPFFARLWRHEAHDAFDGVGNGEVDEFEVDLAGLELRDVEDVADDAEQRFAGFLNGERISRAAFILETEVEQQPVHADDAVHRRTNLVAHVRGDFALHPARSFTAYARGRKLDGLPGKPRLAVPGILLGLMSALLVDSKRAENDRGRNAGEEDRPERVLRRAPSARIPQPAEHAYRGQDAEDRQMDVAEGTSAAHEQNLQHEAGRDGGERLHDIGFGDARSVRPLVEGDAE